MRTDSSPPRSRDARPGTDSVNARDAGLRIAGRAQRWVAALAVGAASAIAAVTAHAYHARAVASTDTRGVQTQPPLGPTDGASTSTASAVPLQPPAAAPVAAAPTDVAPVVSGGS